MANERLSRNGFEKAAKGLVTERILSPLASVYSAVEVVGSPVFVEMSLAGMSKRLVIRPGSVHSEKEVQMNGSENIVCGASVDMAERGVVNCRVEISGARLTEDQAENVRGFLELGSQVQQRFPWGAVALGADIGTALALASDGRRRQFIALSGLVAANVIVFGALGLGIVDLLQNTTADERQRILAAFGGMGEAGRTALVAAFRGANVDQGQLPATIDQGSGNFTVAREDGSGRAVEVYEQSGRDNIVQVTDPSKESSATLALSGAVVEPTVQPTPRAVAVIVPADEPQVVPESAPAQLSLNDLITQAARNRVKDWYDGKRVSVAAAIRGDVESALPFIMALLSAQSLPADSAVDAKVNTFLKSVGATSWFAGDWRALKATGDIVDPVKSIEVGPQFMKPGQKIAAIAWNDGRGRMGLAPDYRQHWLLYPKYAQAVQRVLKAVEAAGSIYKEAVILAINNRIMATQKIPPDQLGVFMCRKDVSVFAVHEAISLFAFSQSERFFAAKVEYLLPGNKNSQDQARGHLLGVAEEWRQAILAGKLFFNPGC